MAWELILGLVFFAFCAGTIDAAVGGGGLKAPMELKPHLRTRLIMRAA